MPGGVTRLLAMGIQDEGFPEYFASEYPDKDLINSIGDKIRDIVHCHIYYYLHEDELDKLLSEICCDIISNNLMKCEHFDESYICNSIRQILLMFYNSDMECNRAAMRMYYREILGKEIYEK